MSEPIYGVADELVLSFVTLRNRDLARRLAEGRHSRAPAPAHRSRRQRSEDHRRQPRPGIIAAKIGTGEGQTRAGQLGMGSCDEAVGTHRHHLVEFR